MYVILNSKYDGQTGYRVCDIYANTEADLPTPQQIEDDFISTGSWIWLGEDRTFKTLNDEKEWV